MMMRQLSEIGCAPAYGGVWPGAGLDAREWRSEEVSRVALLQLMMMMMLVYDRDVKQFHHHSNTFSHYHPTPSPPLRPRPPRRPHLRHPFLGPTTRGQRHKLM